MRTDAKGEHSQNSTAGAGLNLSIKHCGFLSGKKGTVKSVCVLQKSKPGGWQVQQCCHCLLGAVDTDTAGTLPLGGWVSL